MNNAVENTYICKCGCELEFIPMSMGCDIYFIHNGEQINKIFSQPKLANDTWQNYINDGDFETWGELWHYIYYIYHYNADYEDKEDKTQNAILSKKVMKHLYNTYKDIDVPIDAKLSFEFIY